MTNYMESTISPLVPQLQEWLLRRVPASGVRRVLPFLAAMGSDVGLVRNENQDKVAMARGRDGLGEQYVVAILSDGIGGLRYGSQCAALAVSAAVSAIQRQAALCTPPVEWATEAVLSAHRAVRTEYGSEGGATLVLLLVTEADGSYWASIGDSRLYLHANDALLQISTDDTIAGQLGRSWGSDADQGKLIQYIGIDDDLEFEVSKLSHPAGTNAFLTTDGIHFLASNSDALSLIAKHSPDIGTTARRMSELAKWAGGPDNATIAILSLDSSKYEPAPSQGFIDVWDPFGEIRFQLLPSNGRKQVQEKSAPAPALQVEGQEPSRTVESEEPSPALNVDGASKPKSPAKSKVSKSKAKKRKSRAEHGTPVPQVQLEFSDKKS